MTEASASVGLLLATALVIEFLADIEQYSREINSLFSVQQAKKNLSNRRDVFFS